MEPSLTVALQGKRVLMQNRAVSTLLHARDQSLLVPFLRGDAFFSRLEGEWWMRFSGEAAVAETADLDAAHRRSPKRGQGFRQTIAAIPAKLP